MGKTYSVSNGISKPTVHPHAGGENTLLIALLVALLGFTPTRVGKTLVRLGYAVVSTVHPHAGGENVAGIAALVAGLGSPPRGWGKLPSNL